MSRFAVLTFLLSSCAPVLHVRTAELAPRGHLRIAGAMSVTSENVTTVVARAPGPRAVAYATPTTGWDALELIIGAGVADRLELDGFAGFGRQGVELRAAILDERRHDFMSLAAGLAVGSQFRWRPSPGFLFLRSPDEGAPWGRLALDASLRPLPWFLLVANYAVSVGPWTAPRSRAASRRSGPRGVAWAT